MNEGLNISAAGSWSTHKSQRATRGVIAVLGLLSIGLYLLIFRPTTQKVGELEADLVIARREIVETGFGQPENPGNYLKEVQSKVEKMRRLADELYAHMTFRSGLEDLIAVPFRVLEFEQRRFDIQQRLIELADARGSSLPADFLPGLTAYSTAGEEQELLWLHLEFFNHVVGALLSSGRDLQIEQAESLPIQTLGEASGPDGSLLLVQLQLSVEGPATALATFLNASLPENETGSNSIGEKAFSIVRLDIQSDTDSGDGRVTLDTRLAGFIFSEQSF